MRTRRCLAAAPSRRSHEFGSLVGVVGVAICMAAATPAAAFDCPVPQPRTDNSAIKETPARIAQLSEELAADQTGSATTGTIFALTQKYPQAPFAEIVNYMVTAYCPIVASDPSLGHAEKQARLDRYAQQVETLVNQYQGP